MMALLNIYFYGYGMTYDQWYGGMENPDLSMGWAWAAGLSIPYVFVGVLLVRDIAAHIGRKALVAISASLIGAALGYHLDVLIVSYCSLL